MTKKLAAFRLDTELIEGLEQVKLKTGAPIAEQVRRAIRAWAGVTGRQGKVGAQAGGNPQARLRVNSIGDEIAPYDNDERGRR